MRKVLIAVLLALVPSTVTAQITIPNSFETGTLILAASMNENFSKLGEDALDATGGTITGNIAVNTNITIDGLDLSDWLASNNLYAQDGGAAADPSFSWASDTNNGMFLAGTDIVDFATAGTARLRLNADGTVDINSTAADALDVAGGLTIGSGNVALVNAAGKIPDISTTYFASVDGSNLTGLTGINASTGITAGTLPVERGGTEAATFTDGGILLGSGTGAFTVLGVASNGQIPIGDGAGDPQLATLTATTNEVEITNGSASITVGLPDDVTIGDDLDVTGDLEFGSSGVEYVATTYSIADDATQAIPTYGGTLEIYNTNGDYYCMWMLREDNEDTRELIDASGTCNVSKDTHLNTNFYYESGYKLQNTEGATHTYVVIQREFLQ